jgi:magnesium-transporting ATPase (P-type)
VKREALGAPQGRHDWHAGTPDELLAELKSSASCGLSSKEAGDRLLKHGPNRLPPPRQRGPLTRFFLQFHNLLIYVLLTAAAVTAALGHWVDSFVIVHPLIGVADCKSHGRRRALARLFRARPADPARLRPR